MCNSRPVLLKTALRHWWNIFRRAQSKWNLINWPIVPSASQIWHRDFFCAMVLENLSAIVYRQRQWLCGRSLRVRDGQLSYWASQQSQLTLYTSISDRARALLRNVLTVMERTVLWNKWGESSVCVSAGNLSVVAVVSSQSRFYIDQLRTWYEKDRQRQPWTWT